MNKRVLLVFVDPIISPPAQPYGLSIIKSTLETEGISGDIIMPFTSNDPVAYFKETLKNLAPRIVGFSLRNLDVASFHHSESVHNTFLPFLHQMLRACKETLSESLTVLGGCGFSIAPDNILEIVNADLGFTGPSEQEFLTFCKRFFATKNSLININGLLVGLPSAVSGDGADANSITWRDNQGLIRLSEQIPKYPEESIELARIFGGTVPVRTKTGCNLGCTYCVVPSIEPLQMRSTAFVLEEIKHLLEMGLGGRLFIADGEFNLPDKQRAIDICNEMEQRFENLIRWSCYICPSHVNEELVAAMKKAGCIWVGLTADSYSNDALSGLRKAHTVEQGIEATDLFLKHGIDISVNLTFGGPGETNKSIRETLKLAKHFLGKGAHFSPIFGMRVYPNTPLWEIACKKENEEFVNWNVGASWLGTYSKPWPREKIAEIFMQIMPDDKRIHHAKTFDEMETELNQQISSAFFKFQRGYTELAEDELKLIKGKYPYRIEVALALSKVLKAQGKIEEAIKLLQYYI